MPAGSEMPPWTTPEVPPTVVYEMPPGTVYEVVGEVGAAFTSRS